MQTPSRCSTPNQTITSRVAMPRRYMPKVTSEMSRPQAKTMQPRRKLREPSVAQQPDRITKITPPYCWMNTYQAGKCRSRPIKKPRS